MARVRACSRGMADWRARSLAVAVLVAGAWLTPAAGAADPTPGGASRADAAGGASDWPGWRGPQRNGVSTERGLNWTWPATGPKELWRGAVGRGFASFAAARGRVYTLGNRADTDTVVCLDAATGVEVWKHSYACPLDPLSYEGGPSSTPVLDAERLYTLSKSGDVFCLDAASGRVLWSRKLEKPPTAPEDYKVWWGFAGSPLVQGEALVLPVGSAGAAVNKLTGAPLWDTGPGRPGYSSPVAFEHGAERAFALLSGHEIVAARVSDGAVLWRLPWRTTWDQNAPDVVIDGGRLFVTTGHGVGCGLFDLSATPPTPVWRNANLRSELSTPVLWQKHLYGFDGRRLVCLDWQTGEACWSAEDTQQGSLVLVDGRLVALQQDGQLLVVEATPAAYRLQARAKVLSARCWSAPAVADGRLFVRNAEGTVVCLSLQGSR